MVVIELVAVQLLRNSEGEVVAKLRIMLTPIENGQELLKVEVSDVKRH
jgi:hypothetical protein